MSELNIEGLRKYCYFSHLSDGALDAISRNFEPVEMPAGATVIREGEPADSFYLVSSGEVEVLKKTKWGQEARISVVGHGNVFGEMALLTCSPRCCSVVAVTDVKLLRLKKSHFNDVVNLDSTFSQLVEHRIDSMSSLIT